MMIRQLNIKIFGVFACPYCKSEIDMDDFTNPTDVYIQYLCPKCDGIIDYKDLLDNVIGSTKLLENFTKWKDCASKRLRRTFKNVSEIIEKTYSEHKREIDIISSFVDVMFKQNIDYTFRVNNANMAFFCNELIKLPRKSYKMKESTQTTINIVKRIINVFEQSENDLEMNLNNYMTHLWLLLKQLLHDNEKALTLIDPMKLFKNYITNVLHNYYSDAGFDISSETISFIISVFTNRYYSENYNTVNQNIEKVKYMIIMEVLIEKYGILTVYKNEIKKMNERFDYCPNCKNDIYDEDDNDEDNNSNETNDKPRNFKPRYCKHCYVYIRKDKYDRIVDNYWILKIFNIYDNSNEARTTAAADLSSLIFNLVLFVRGFSKITNYRFVTLTNSSVIADIAAMTIFKNDTSLEIDELVNIYMSSILYGNMVKYVAKFLLKFKNFEKRFIEIVKDIYRPSPDDVNTQGSLFDIYLLLSNSFYPTTMNVINDDNKQQNLMQIVEMAKNAGFIENDAITINDSQHYSVNLENLTIIGKKFISDIKPFKYKYIIKLLSEVLPYMHLVCNNGMNIDYRFRDNLRFFPSKNVQNCLSSWLKAAKP